MIYTAKQLQQLEEPPVILYRFRFELDENKQPAKSCRYPMPGHLYIPYPKNQVWKFTPHHPSFHHPLMERTEDITGQEFADTEAEAKERYDEKVNLAAMHLQFQAHCMSRHYSVMARQPRIRTKAHYKFQEKFEIHDTESWMKLIQSGQLEYNQANCFAILEHAYYDECGLTYWTLAQPIEFDSKTATIDGFQVKHQDIGMLLHGRDSTREIILQML